MENVLLGVILIWLLLLTCALFRAIHIFQNLEGHLDNLWEFSRNMADQVGYLSKVDDIPDTKESLEEKIRELETQAESTADAVEKLAGHFHAFLKLVRDGENYRACPSWLKKGLDASAMSDAASSDNQ